MKGNGDSKENIFSKEGKKYDNNEKSTIIPSYNDSKNNDDNEKHQENNENIDREENSIVNDNRFVVYKKQINDNIVNWQMIYCEI